MDIARLPSAGYAASAYPVPSRNRERVLELVAEVDAVPRVREPVERIVQGEVLQRQRTAYSPTQDYLNSRLLDGAYISDEDTAAAEARTNPGHAQRAAGAYLSHTRELIQPDINRGKQVDYFI
ncbi:MAG TPA: hypothetical protein VIR60_04345 [Gammaproteobacteria bacterium]